MNDRRRVLGNLISLAAIRGLDYLIPLITLPYLVRVLGLEGFGLVNYALSLALYFAAIMQFGFSVTAVRKIARARGNSALIAEIYSETVIAITLLVVACALVYFSVIFMVDKFHQHSHLYIFSFFFIAAQALFPVWFFQGMENMRHGAIINIASKLIILCGIFTFINEPEDYYLVPAINAAAMLGCVVISAIWISCRYQVTLQIPPFRDIWSIYKEGWDAFISQLAPNFYNNSATFFLGLLSGASAVGVFSAASRIVDVFNSVGIITSSAFFPYLARNPKNVRSFHKLMLVTGSGLTLLCFSSAEWIAATLFSGEDETIAHFVRLMSVGVLACFAVLSYHNNGLMLIGRDDVVKRISIGASLLCFVAGSVLIYYFGIYGAIVMLVGGRFIMALAGGISFAIYKRSTP